MNKIKTSLFLTTYNWPDALHICIKSIFKQSVLPDEVIIADDGSDKETSQLIAKLKKESPIPIVHLWQENQGYRINTLRNLAIRNASYPYIIQIDGDLILDTHFVADHISFARQNRFLIGRRVNLSQEATDCAMKHDYEKCNISKVLRNKTLAKLHHFLLYNKTNVKGVRGCNMSYWKKDAYKVNGYDEDMTSKGPNDKEFAARLVNAGIEAYNLKFYANSLHFSHGETNRTNYTHVKGIFEETLKTKKIRCANGLLKNN